MTERTRVDARRLTALPGHGKNIAVSVNDEDEGELCLPNRIHSGPCWVSFRLGYYAGSCLCIAAWADALGMPQRTLHVEPVSGT